MGESRGRKRQEADFSPRLKRGTPAHNCAFRGSEVITPQPSGALGEQLPSSQEPAKRSPH